MPVAAVMAAVAIALLLGKRFLLIKGSMPAAATIVVAIVAKALVSVTVLQVVRPRSRPVPAPDEARAVRAGRVPGVLEVDLAASRRARTGGGEVTTTTGVAGLASPIGQVSVAALASGAASKSGAVPANADVRVSRAARGSVVGPTGGAGLVNVADRSSVAAPVNVTTLSGAAALAGAAIHVAGGETEATIVAPRRRRKPRNGYGDAWRNCGLAAQVGTAREEVGVASMTSAISSGFRSVCRSR